MNDHETHLVLRVRTSPSGRLVFEYCRAGVEISPPFYSLDDAAAWLKTYRRINKGGA